MFLKINGIADLPFQGGNGRFRRNFPFQMEMSIFGALPLIFRGIVDFTKYRFQTVFKGFVTMGTAEFPGIEKAAEAEATGGAHRFLRERRLHILKEAGKSGKGIETAKGKVGTHHFHGAVFANMMRVFLIVDGLMKFHHGRFFAAFFT